MLRAADSGNIPGFNGLRRTAETTASYSEAVRQVGKERSVQVCDVWSAMMREAGWAEDSTGKLPGCEDAEENALLRRFFSDGRILFFPGMSHYFVNTADGFQDSISLRTDTGCFSTSSGRSSRIPGPITSPRTCLWSCRLGATWKLGRTFRDAHNRCSLDCSEAYTTFSQYYFLVQDFEQQLAKRKIPRMNNRTIN
jgi:hypothetical protein